MGRHSAYLGEPARRPAAPRDVGRANWARLALLALLASVLVALVSAGLRSVFWVLAGLAGLAVAAIGVWWVLAHSGVMRVAGVALSVMAPIAVLTLYATAGMLWPALCSLVLWVLAVMAAHKAVAREHAASRRASAPAEAPRHPWILMNPRSGGGKVERFHLVDKARAAGARVVLLGTDNRDPAELAGEAVAEGADLLAVAGGDGTQALVAEVAARHKVPFMVIPAGTRNHFALDLGLDRDDPAASLQALTDGVELRVDLGFAADRVFVNNASFGTYAAVVGDPAYRGEKVQTTLQSLPHLLTGPDAPTLRMRAGTVHADGLQALLISNNPYQRAVDLAHPGRRERLDSGLLGVIGVRVANTAQAARIVRGARSGSLVRLQAQTVVVETETATVPAGIDGEHVLLQAPVVCRTAPGALRVRVPRGRPHAPLKGQAADWRRVARLAFGSQHDEHGRGGSRRAHIDDESQSRPSA
ncbi:diacylglycerol kinase family protein [Streptomyces albidochromogenes]|uniref:diacylglycerol kinase family protein n=1 Tax=Streptomyces albidochromogenes TaxID=329524 RepID=UPI00110FD63A